MTNAEDEQTRQPLSESRAETRQLFPALTVACHPDPGRVGDRALLTRCVLGGASVELSRLQPEFTQMTSGDRAALKDSFLSRKPYVSFHGEGLGLRLKREQDGVELKIDGEALVGERVLEPSELEQGAVLELAKRHVLIVHRAGPRVETDSHRLIGDGDGLGQVRRAISEVAALDVKVLIRGETGVGKELVAQALHTGSPRAQEPSITVNMAAIQPSLAASALFGHVKGAFSGATADHLGFFREADGGTLFLDEVGECPPDIQPMLLRVLETGEVRPLGSSKVYHVNTRVISATDANLEQAASSGHFRSPLLHRLAEFVIRVPALRERREDIPRLLLHFLKVDLAGLDALALLEPSADDRPWLDARTVALLCRQEWPGNIRQLRNVARQLAIAGRGEGRLRLTDEIERDLSMKADARPSTSALQGETASRPAVSSPKPEARRLDDISEDEVVRALEAHGYRREAAARSLGISKTSMYELISRSTRIKKASDLQPGEIEAARVTCDDDNVEMARMLGVSARGLKLRQRELGLP